MALTIDVYHRHNIALDQDIPEFPSDEFRLVARVSSQSLDEAFEVTNHIEQSWTLNDGVEVIYPSRSTSVGDVLVSGGQAFLCEPVGWRELR